MGQLGSRDVPRFCAVPCTFPSLAASPEAQDNLRRISPRCEVVSPRPPIAPSPRLLQCAAHGRPGAVAPCERGRLPALRAASCELHTACTAQFTHNAPKECAPVIQRRDAQQSGPANVPGPPASRVEQVMAVRTVRCADVLLDGVGTYL
jgi:hypothetical protein